MAGEWLFVVTDDARLICLSRTSGKARWITQLPHYGNEKKKTNAILWYGPVLAGGKLVLTSSRGEVQYVSAADGKIGATEKVKKAVFSLPPIVANSTLYTLDGRGRIVAWK